MILARSSPETACAEKKGVLRVNDYKQSVAMESDGNGGTKGDWLMTEQSHGLVILNSYSRTVI